MVKKVGTAFYAHKSNLNEFFDTIFNWIETQPYNNYNILNFIDLHSFFIRLINFFEPTHPEFSWDVVKFTNWNITLISSPDWDFANEPIVGTCYRWKKDNWFEKDIYNNILRISENYKKIENWKQIYHNKWQFVSPDYTGFDVEEAINRTNVWNTIPNINSLKNKIGYKNYWKNLLEENNIPL